MWSLKRSIIFLKKIKILIWFPLILTSLIFLFILPLFANPVEIVDFVESRTVEAKVEGRSHSNVSGLFEFTKTKEGIRIKGYLEHLKPNSKHGFHIHEKGDCTAKDAQSAGPHFNPTKQMHGNFENEKSHAGDLGNIDADSNGKANVEIFVKDLKLFPSDDKMSIVGKSIVVHKAKDNFKTQPSGASGARIGCGVIISTKR